MAVASLKKPLTLTAATLGICLLASGAAHADRLDDIKSRGSLSCGTLSTNQPMGYQDPDTRKIVGFDVDTCEAIAKHMGVKMEHKPISVEARIPELALGRVDLVAAALGFSKERAKQIAFSDAHYQIPIKIIVGKTSGLKAIPDLAGKKLSATKGSTPEQFARQVLPTAEVVTYQDSPTAFLALQQGKVQGMAISQLSGVRYVSETGSEYQFMDGQLHWEPTAIGVKKGEPALLAAVNKALVEMDKSGEMDAIWNKWFGPTTLYKLTRDKKLTPISTFE